MQGAVQLSCGGSQSLPPHRDSTPAPSSNRRGAVCSPVAVAQLKLGGLLAGLGGVVVAYHPAGQLHAGEGEEGAASGELGVRTPATLARRMHAAASALPA